MDLALLHVPRFTLSDAAKAIGKGTGTLSQQVQRGIMEPTAPSENPHRPHLYSGLDILRWAFLNKLTEAAGVPFSVAKEAADDIFGEGATLSSCLTTDGVDAWFVLRHEQERWVGAFRLAPTEMNYQDYPSAEAIIFLPASALVKDVLGGLRKLTAS